MTDKHRDTYGPDWLDAYADRMCNNGQELEAVAFRQMAKQWKTDQAAVAAAQSDCTRLQRRLDQAAGVLIASGPQPVGASDRRAAA